MPSAQALISKIAAVLARVNATDRAVFKRIATKTGGDPLLGRGGSVSTTDTLLTPQPAVEFSTGPEAMVRTNGMLVPLGGCLMIVSALAMTRDEVFDDGTTIVMKDTNGREEVFTFSNAVPRVFEGKDIAFECVLESKKR